MKRADVALKDDHESLGLTLGTCIRLRRKMLGLSQEQLAERMSTGMRYVRQTEVSRLELDKVSLPRRDRLEALARALDLPLGELLSLSGWNARRAPDRQPSGMSSYEKSEQPLSPRH